MFFRERVQSPTVRRVEVKKSLIKLLPDITATCHSIKAFYGFVDDNNNSTHVHRLSLIG